MQFSFNVNEILKNSIDIIDSKAKLGHVPYVSDLNSVKSMNDADKLSCIIDEMGKASAIAQQLPRPITSSSKLRHSDHRIYFLKVDDGAKGEVVGMLKVGYKTLFVYDNQSNQNELKPLCVLDFYVHESKQRQGYGKKLFDNMLQSEKVQVHHVAIDRPSPKFLFFLGKHYQLTEKIPQLNNFVVFVNFFNGRPDTMHRFNSGSLRRSRPSEVHSQMSPTKDVRPAHKETGTTAPTSRRVQSGASKDRVLIPIEGFSKALEHAVPDTRGPPALPRTGTPQAYRTLLGPMPVAKDNHLPQGATLPPARGHCDRARRDYNYSHGLARHYSHTRLW